MRHALFVAFHYPPEASSSGVLRTLKYTRYLTEYGWRTTVIAPKVDAYSLVDRALERQIPHSTRVLRTPYLNTKRHLALRGLYPAVLAIPDRWIGWLPWGVAAGRHVLAEDPFDLVYSTSPHATAHLIAWRLAKLSGKPWVADFRDPWIEEPPEPGTPTGFVYSRLNRWLERRAIEDATCVVASTAELRDTLRARYSKQPRDKMIAIRNGYDEADFTDLAPRPPTPGDRMTILHAGSINADFRNPVPLLQAARACADAGSIDLKRLRLRFLGPGDYGASPELKGVIDRLDLREVVEVAPRVPYAEALAALASADVLLLLQASDDTKGLVPAKLYEYLRAQKALLALVHPGATQEVLSITGGGWSVVPENAIALQETLARAFEMWRLGSLSTVRADLASLRSFDRKALTGELAGVFDSLMAVRDPSNSVIQSTREPTNLLS